MKEDTEIRYAGDADAELCRFCGRIFAVRELFVCECGRHISCRGCLDAYLKSEVDLTQADDR